MIEKIKLAHSLGEVFSPGSLVNAKLNQYYPISLEISRQERQIEALSNEVNLIKDRFADLEAQIISISKLNKQKKEAKYKSKVGIVITAIAAMAMIGINVHHSDDGFSFKYESGNLVNLIITLCGGSGIFYTYKNKAQQQSYENETDQLISFENYNNHHQ